MLVKLLQNKFDRSGRHFVSAGTEVEPIFINPNFGYAIILEDKNNEIVVLDRNEYRILPEGSYEPRTYLVYELDCTLLEMDNPVWCYSRMDATRTAFELARDFGNKEPRLIDGYWCIGDQEYGALIVPHFKSKSFSVPRREKLEDLLRIKHKGAKLQKPLEKTTLLSLPL